MEASGSRAPRALNERERQVLERLLAVEFTGAANLRAQAESVRVREQWPDGPSIDLIVDASAPSAEVDGRVPVEGRWSHPESGAPYELLLHVIDGRLGTVELVDGWGAEELVELPPADDIEIS